MSADIKQILKKIYFDPRLAVPAFAFFGVSGKIDLKAQI